MEKEKNVSRRRNVNILGIFNILIMFGAYLYIGARCSMVNMEYISDYAVSFVGIGLCFINIAIVMFIQIILHEGGHLIAGLATGYKFVSFRIGTNAVIKGKDNKLHFKKMKIKGTAGQCLLTPPSVETERCPYKLYHLGGGIANITISTISLILYIYFMPKNPLTFALFEEFGIIGLAMGITNIIPSKVNGITNDGANYIELGKNLDAKKCLNIVLKLNALLTVADDYSELPKEFVEEIKSIDFSKMDLTDTSVANAYANQSGIYFAEENYEKAYEINRNIIETPGILELFKNEARCECLFYEITHNMDKEKIDKLYDKNLKQYVKVTEIYPSRLRLMYAYNLLYLKDVKKAEEYYKKLENSVDTYIIKADAIQELKIAQTLKNSYIKRDTHC